MSSISTLSPSFVVRKPSSPCDIKQTMQHCASSCSGSFEKSVIIFLKFLKKINNLKLNNNEMIQNQLLLCNLDHELNLCIF